MTLFGRLLTWNINLMRRDSKDIYWPRLWIPLPLVKEKKTFAIYHHYYYYYYYYYYYT